MRFANTMLLALLFSAVAAAQPPQPPAPTKVEDVYLAKDNGAGKAGDYTESFTTGDVPIYCVVMLSVTDPTPVRMLLVAVKVPGVKPGSKVVSASYRTKQGQDRVYFSGKPEGNWVPGTYRFDIFVEDEKPRSIEFDIKGSALPAGATKFAPLKPPRRTR